MEALEIYRHFQIKTEEGLRHIDDDKSLFLLLDSLYRELDLLMARTIQENAIVVACTSGCSYCCYLKVDVRSYEVLYLYHHMRCILNNLQINEISRRARERHNAIGRMNARNVFTANLPCPLLYEGKCSVYSVRPFLCRRFHAQTENTCKYSYDHPEDMAAPHSQNQILEISSAAAVAGISQAFDRMDYDQAVYDLGSALQEGISNPKAYRRWRDRKAAFTRKAYSRDYIQGLES